MVSRTKCNWIERFGKHIASGKIKSIYKSLQDVKKEDLSHVQQVVNLATLTDSTLGDLQLLDNISMFHNFWNLLDIKKIENVLFTSSGAVYGKNQESLTFLNEVDSNNFNNNYKNLGYGLGKFASEFLGFEWSKRDHINFKVARLFSFSGAFIPLGSNYVIGNFVKNVLNNEEDYSDYKNIVFVDLCAQNTDFKQCLTQIRNSGEVVIEAEDNGANKYLTFLIKNQSSLVLFYCVPPTGFEPALPP